MNDAADNENGPGKTESPEKTAEARRLFAAAQDCLAAADFESARKHLDDIPESCRNTDFSTMSELVDARLREIAELIEEIRSRLSAGKEAGLLPKVRRLIELNPGDEETNGLRHRLEAQELPEPKNRQRDVRTEVGDQAEKPDVAEIDPALTQPIAAQLPNSQTRSDTKPIELDPIELVPIEQSPIEQSRNELVPLPSTAATLTPPPLTESPPPKPPPLRTDGLPPPLDTIGPLDGQPDEGLLQPAASPPPLPAGEHSPSLVPVHSADSGALRIVMVLLLVLLLLSVCAAIVVVIVKGPDLFISAQPEIRSELCESEAERLRVLTRMQMQSQRSRVTDSGSVALSQIAGNDVALPSS